MGKNDLSENDVLATDQVVPPPTTAAEPAYTPHLSLDYYLGNLDVLELLARAEDLQSKAAGIVAFARAQIAARTAHEKLREIADAAEDAAVGALRDVVELRAFIKNGNFTKLTEKR